MPTITRRGLLKTAGAGAALAAIHPTGADPACAQVKTRLSIATGGTGGVYYPVGGGIAALISRYARGVEATAEATAASVDNLKLLHAGKVALALSGADITAEERAPASGAPRIRRARPPTTRAAAPRSPTSASITSGRTSSRK